MGIVLLNISSYTSTTVSYGRATYSFKSLESSFASLYAGTFCQLTMGRIGMPALGIIGRPFKSITVLVTAHRNGKNTERKIRSV